MKRIAAIALLLGLTPGAQGATQLQVFEAEYAVEYLGIRVAKSTFRSTISSQYFEMTGHIKSAGLAQFFDSTEGHTYATGGFGKNGTRPRGYLVQYSYGKKAKKTKLAFDEGVVSTVENSPALPNRNPGWVEVSAKHLKSVVDPMSATLVKAEGPGRVCGRTVQIFDGEIRANIVLSPSSATPARVPGAETGAVVCSARFVPVAGYYPTNKSLGYLRDNSRVEITFAPLGRTGVYAPVYASVGTRYGPVTIRASKLKVSN